jgi:CubicO group peptidase (beta-lactamase class C family)
VERIFGLKRWIEQRKPAQDHPLRVYKLVEHPSHTGLAAQAAESAVTLLNKSELFPLDLPKIKTVIHLVFTDSEFYDQPLLHFCCELKGFFDHAEILNNPSLSEIESRRYSEQTITVVSLYFRTFAGHTQYLDWKGIKKTLQLLRESDSTVVLFLFGNPYQLNHLPRKCIPDAVFLTYSYVQVSQEAAFKALCSFIDIQGNLPISLNKPFENALHIPAKTYRFKKTETPEQEEKSLDKLVEKAIGEGIFPGCVIFASRGGDILLNKGYGRFDYEKNSPPAQPDTLYDLASLTKVLATTPAIMKLLESGELRLQQTLDHFYPQLQNDPKSKITIADLLSHQSGMPAWKPLYEDLGLGISDFGFINSREIVAQVLRTPLEFNTGEKAVYSDLGFILLYDIIEKISGISFDTFCRDQIFQPLGLHSLQFIPPKKLRKQIPPTGTDALREDIIRGAVNDTNCFAMGGVSGHAGLFGNSLDVAAAGQLFVQKGIYNSRRLFKSSTIELFSKKYNPDVSVRTLGWDTPTPGGSGGKYFSESAIGHLGYTGTSLWVDLQQEINIVLLSNRVHPDPRKNRMREIRPQIHDAVMKELLK